MAAFFPDVRQGGYLSAPDKTRKVPFAALPEKADNASSSRPKLPAASPPPPVPSVHSKNGTRGCRPFRSQEEKRAPHCPAFSILNTLNPFLRFLNIKISLFRFFLLYYSTSPFSCTWHALSSGYSQSIPAALLTGSSFATCS